MADILSQEEIDALLSVCEDEDKELIIAHQNLEYYKTFGTNVC